MTPTQKVFVTAALAAAVSAAIYEAYRAHRLEQKIRSLQQKQSSLIEQFQHLHRERDEALNRLSALAAEREHAGTASGELLKLHAEVTRLRNEAEAAAAELKEAKDFQSRVMQIFSNTPPIRTFVSTTSTTVSWDQGIAAGGWIIPSGNRAIVLAKVRSDGAAGHVIIESVVLEYTEDAGNALGLARFNTDGHTTTRTQKLGADEFDAMLAGAKNHEGVKVVMTPIISTVSGQAGEIRVQASDQALSGERYATGPVINFIPTISPDGQSVQLSFAAQLNYPIPLPQLQTP